MLSKNKIKLINRLKTKKGRKETGMFLVEGEKMLKELLSSDFIIEFIVGLPEWMSSNSLVINKVNETIETDNTTLKKLSSFTTPNNVLAVAGTREHILNPGILNGGLTLILDTIQDPGNLGTIIRTAAWFGIENILCSQNSADVYNPKVVQATMGAIFRVKVFYAELEDFFRKMQPTLPVYGTFLEGENIYTHSLTNNGFIVFGNESKGIRASLEKYINHKITVPGFPQGQKTMESLNITSAVAIVCSEFRKRMQY